MRPRVFPAEDLPQNFSAACIIAWCFNEAAGIPRGRREHSRSATIDSVLDASMRPRVFPAEDFAWLDHTRIALSPLQ